MAFFKIANKFIGDDYPCFIIAEAGSNHNGSYETARKLVDVAVEAEADAVKFQFFKAEKIAADTTHEIARFDGKTLFEFYKECEADRNWIPGIAKYCEEKGIIFLATPFDKEAIDLLEEAGAPAYKISSFEIVDIILLKQVAEKKKPLIISSGMADLEDINDALDAVYSKENKHVAILHAGINYPVPFDDVNLRAMDTIRNRFNVVVGYSDHSSGITVPIAAVARGAKIIEKHFTLNSVSEGPDHSFALEPNELKSMVKAIRECEKSLGSYKKKHTDREVIHYKRGRRSIFAAKDIEVGDKLTMECFAVLRPGVGLKPKYIYSLIGKTARLSVKKNEPIGYDIVNEKNQESLK